MDANRSPFEIQGHRGSRGTSPENTLPSMEHALDAGVTSIETDLHLTGDGVPVLTHDPFVSERICRPRLGSTAPPPTDRPPIRRLDLAQLRDYVADGNPDPSRFPDQRPEVTPLAGWFAARRGTKPFAVPTLADLFAFSAAYAGEAGRRVGKSADRRERAGRVWFDLELKRVPFRPERPDDGWTPEAGGLLEERVLAEVRAAGVLGRTRVRSFDHRVVRIVRRLEPRLETAVLVAGTAPVAPAELARAAGADVYCPQVEFLDADQVRDLHAAGVRVLPWTVNDPADWHRLIGWGVDGITTDYPARLAEYAGIRLTGGRRGE